MPAAEPYDKSAAQAELAKMIQGRWIPHPGQFYRHHKGGLYRVVAVSIRESTGAILITYRSSRRGTYWTRTFDEWGVITLTGPAWTPLEGLSPLLEWTRDGLRGRSPDQA